MNVVRGNVVFEVIDGRSLRNGHYYGRTMQKAGSGPSLVQAKPPSAKGEAKAVVASYRKALQQAPPPRLVVLSSVGSRQSSGLGMITATHVLEDGLGDLPFPAAFIRAGSFLENYAFGLKAAAASGWFDTYLTPTDRAFPMIATEDIGKPGRALVG